MSDREYFQFLAFRWDVTKARNIAAGLPVHRLNGGNQTAVRILARNDTSGPHHTAVNASLWHRWATQLADLRCQMKATSPRATPATPCALLTIKEFPT